MLKFGPIWGSPISNFRKISKPIFMAAHMGVEWELKFSPTLLVGGDKHHLIRWSIVPLGKLVRTRGSLVRTPPPPPPPLARTHRTARPSRHDAPRVAGISPSRALFLQSGKTVWTDASQLVGSGRSRIVGYCNRPKTCATWTWPTLYPLGFSRAALYKVVRCNDTEPI